MSVRGRGIAVLLTVSLGGIGCQTTPVHELLDAPPGTVQVAARHNAEGVLAYQAKQYDSARQHFEAAIAASPDLAEAHYNLGMTLYRRGAVAEGKAHFLKAADLAPGNKVIWDSPPLRNVSVPSKSVELPGGTDGHFGHSH